MRHFPAPALVCASVLACTAAADITITTVAMTGESAPGLPGVTFSFLSDARVNPDGRVVFWAELSGTGVSNLNNGSLWTRLGATTTLLLREGAAVPSQTGLVFAALPRPALGATGDVALVAVSSPPDQTSPPIAGGVLLIDAAGTPRFLAQEGTPAAGLPAGTNYAGFTGASLTAGGSVLWQGNAGAAVWTGSASEAPTALAVRGDAAPGAPGTLDYLDVPGSAPAGQGYFRATTLDGAARGMGLWGAGAGSPIALAGQQVPGAPAGVVYDEVGPGAVACAGDCVSFFSRVAGPGVTMESDGVILTGSAGALSLLAREGDPAPGTGALFGVLSAQISGTPEGDVAFRSSLAGPGVTVDNNSAIFVTGAGLASLAAREGDPAPGLGGITLAGFGPVAISPRGVIAFVGALHGAGVTPANNRALYVRDGAGSLALVVRTGAIFNGGAGDRTIEEVLIDSDPTQGGHGAFTETAAGSLLLFKLHFKDAGPNNTVLRASGLFTALVPTMSCYANCDGSTVAPVLNVLDFSCFLTRFASGDAYANCDASTTPPVLNVQDFSCFLQRFATGCR